MAGQAADRRMQCEVWFESLLEYKCKHSKVTQEQNTITLVVAAACLSFLEETLVFL